MAATRSKTKSIEKKTLDSNILGMIKEELSAFLKSDTFKDIVHTAVIEAMNNNFDRRTKERFLIALLKYKLKYGL